VSSSVVTVLLAPDGASFTLVTSMVITHDMATAFEIADRVMLLENGRFVGEGPPERFFASNDPSVRTFADASAVEPQKLMARRAGRKTPAQIREAWRAAQAAKG
jgi:ABC-type transporter Mla maintaining outer membrane lipid asymmetry ATPase subunit MlaF